MPHTYSTHIVFICPYYRADTKEGWIRCDCGKLMFGDRKEALRYFGQYCANNPGWERCSLAKHMTDKILREEGNGEDDA